MDESILHDIIKYGLDPKKAYKKLNSKGELKKIESRIEGNTLHINCEIQKSVAVDEIVIDISSKNEELISDEGVAKTVTLDELHNKWLQKEDYRNALVKLEEKEVKVKKERKKPVRKNKIKEANVDEHSLNKKLDE